MVGRTAATAIVCNDRRVPVSATQGALCKVEVTSKQARVRARFDNGLPAIVEHRVGKGRAIYFAANPFTAPSIGSSDWATVLRDLHCELGGSVGHDIWRFQLPARLVDYTDPDAPGKACLTGNYAFWYRARLVEGGDRYNIAPAGRYTIETAGQSQTFAFTDGTLTNRLLLLREPKRAVTAVPSWKKLEFDPNEWVSTLSDPAPARVTFTFDRAHRITYVRLFFTGELPGLTVAASADGKTWSQVARVTTSVTTRDKEVRRVSVAITPTTARHLRLSVPKRSHPTPPLRLVEVDIWGQRP